MHDYHLMRLPAELRARSKTIRVAWYLHTPFPTSEIYRILPVRRELLEGLLQADLVGFQAIRRMAMMMTMDGGGVVG